MNARRTLACAALFACSTSLVVLSVGCGDKSPGVAAVKGARPGNEQGAPKFRRVRLFNGLSKELDEVRVYRGADTTATPIQRFFNVKPANTATASEKFWDAEDKTKASYGFEATKFTVTVIVKESGANSSCIQAMLDNGATAQNFSELQIAVVPSPSGAGFYRLALVGFHVDDDDANASMAEPTTSGTEKFFDLQSSAMCP